MFGTALFTSCFLGIGMGVLMHIFSVDLVDREAPSQCVVDIHAGIYRVGYFSLALDSQRRVDRSQQTWYRLYAIAFVLVCVFVGSVTLTKYLENQHGAWGTRGPFGISTH